MFEKMWSTLPKSYTKSKKNGCKITMEDIEGIEYHEEDWKRQTDSQYQGVSIGGGFISFVLILMLP